MLVLPLFLRLYSEHLNEDLRGSPAGRCGAGRVGVAGRIRFRRVAVGSALVGGVAIERVAQVKPRSGKRAWGALVVWTASCQKVWLMLCVTLRSSHPVHVAL